MTWSPELIVGIIVAAFGGGGVAALFKLRGESAKIVVDAASGAVVVQSGVIDELREEIAELRREIAELKRAKKTADDQVAIFKDEAHKEAARADAAEGLARMLMRANDDLREHMATLEGRFNDRFPTDPPT